MTIENKERNKKTKFRFIQGAVVGSIVTIIIFYGLNHKEHERMHELLKKHGIEEHGH
jgi:patatin-like phospholipase/acyl hydrolase